ncbi:MAG: ABC transporter ATP-binding protein [bacterium]|nr:ABC transporter ATP-binding protein [bacterium]
MEQIIEVSGLKKQFGEVKAVDDLSFSVEKGELFGFLGVNGAGKSTTINMLCTLLAPTAGAAKLCGYALGAEDERIRKQIGVVWQHNCLDDRLSVKENLYVRGSLYGFRAQALHSRVDRVCEALHLEDIFTTFYRRLSGGQKRRCEIAAALINTPEILFLDEPTTGLDPQTRQFVWESMRTLQKENGTTIFLTTHYMEEAANARHIAIIDRGKILEYGTPFSLKEQYAKDRLHLIPKNGREAELMQMLANAGVQVTAKTQADGRVTVVVRESMNALEILNAVKPCICGFEMIQGTLDDVFLNVTGKSLEPS